MENASSKEKHSLLGWAQFIIIMFYFILFCIVINTKKICCLKVFDCKWVSLQLSKLFCLLFLFDFKKEMV